MTPDSRHRAPFELLRFTAAAVSADVGVIELEGRFASASRSGRQPVLVVEHGEGPRTDLPPVHAVRDGDRWSAVFAVPLAALDGGTFALGLRGTLLDLPTPDVADDGDRLAGVAREANALRRRVEVAEDAAAAARAETEDAQVAARAEAEEAAAALAAAVAAARDEAADRAAALEATHAERLAALEQVHGERVATLEQAREAAEAEAGERVAAVEAEIAEARRDAAAERDEAQRRTAREVADARAEVAASQEAAYAAAIARADAAEQDAAAVTDLRTEEAEARADAAEERANEAEALASAVRAEGARVHDRVGGDGDQDDPLLAAQRAAKAAEDGIAVLRAELAEERERAVALQAQLAEARGGVGTTADRDVTTVAPAGPDREVAADRGATDRDETTVAPVGADRDATTVAPAAADRDAAADRHATTIAPAAPPTSVGPPAVAPTSITTDTPATLKTTDHPPGAPISREAARHATGPTPTRWFAVAAIAVFVFVLLGLLLGFLP